MNTIRTTRRLAATTTYQSINADGNGVYAIINNSGEQIMIKMNSGGGEIPLNDGTFWEFATNLGAVSSLIEIKIDSGTGFVDYII